MPETVKGVAPGFLLLPAREYEWVLESRVQIRVPNSGELSGLLSETDKVAGVSFPGEDSFELFSDNLLLLWQVVRVLFAASKYPNLEDNQSLNVVALEIEGDEIVVHGEVIRRV